MRWAIWLVPLVAAACLSSPPGGGGGDGGVVERCGTIGALRDTFDEANDRWEGADTLGDGRVQIYAGPGESRYLMSNWHYLVEGGELVLDLRSLDLQTDGELRLLLIAVNDDSIGLDLLGDSLSLRVDVNDDVTSPASMRWQPDQLYWRLREEGGAIHWGVSTDGARFTEGERVENPLFGPVKVLVDLSATAGQAVVDIEAINPDSTETACPLVSFVDDFSAELPRWVPTDSPNCQASAIGDNLVIDYDGDDVCGLLSLERFDARGGSAAIEVADLADCDPSFFLELRFADRSAELRCLDEGDGPKLNGGLYGSSSETVVTVDFDPALYHYWRISSPPGSSMIELATADVSGVWTTLGSRPVDEADLAEVSVNLLVIDGTPGGEVESVAVDNFNLVPP